MTDAPAFTFTGRLVFRNGQPFADAASPEIAEALAIILHGQVLIDPSVPAAKQDWVAGVLWP